MAVAVDRVDMLFNEMILQLRGQLSSFSDAFAIVGAIYTTQKTLNIVCGCYRAISVYGLPKLRRRPDLVSRYGPWALVTGCTDGIGKAYAQELASCGMNIILISRSNDKLIKCAKDLESQFRIQTQVVTADFSQGGAIYAMIEEEIKDKEIGILVNNVGVMYYPECLHEMNLDRIFQLINVNITAATIMSRIVLPQMVERKKGAVVNLTAAASIRPNPQLAVYTATKTYLDFLTQSLQYEYEDKGITVQSLMPCYVATKMTKYGQNVPSPGYFIPSASLYARRALSTLGVSSRTTGYWPHQLQLWIAEMIPDRMWLWGANIVNSAIKRRIVQQKKRGTLASSSS
ncbi:inactive hydroxysteroid dehydrogenase-like protein 1 [Anneissia japonica]|uniref:inactive hydroxysteroid dehydrogenase-like protein 1 n=1 Tax=Anneissia japonica TaxID=1529436 RepID=UPI00142559BA|nr:inactive hydroxysteroid dehydrogenase-like protein 1 [Anneissia japonica]